YVVKVTDPDNNEAFLRANQGNRSSSFSATSSFYALKHSGIDPDLAGEELQDAGGIAGIAFELEEIQLKGFFDEGGGAAVHDHFSILATAGSLTLQVGPNEGDDHRVTFSVDDMGSDALGIGGGFDVSTQQAAFTIIDGGLVDTAINRVSKQRGRLGAVQNRLEHTIKNLGVTKENLQSSESRIRDADMAKEMMEFTKFQIMLQAGTAMLAQANTIPQNVLQLLG
ncbi:MAG: flagellin, partial [bacterium]|nr:flagellin [bacterium]